MTIKKVDNFYIATVGNVSFYAEHRLDAMCQASAFVWGMK